MYSVKVCTFILIGLDATASLQLLKHLDTLADSNRTVILTIHQPRMEIFGMFNQLILLSNGKVSNSDYNMIAFCLSTNYDKVPRPGTY